MESTPRPCFLESSAPEENMEELAGATLDAYTHTRAAVSQPRKSLKKYISFLRLTE